MPTQFVDYKVVKQSVSIEQILDRYGLMDKLRGSGDSRSGPCPIHGGHDISQFRVSLSKNCWQCFGKCKRGGNIIDFVTLKEGIAFRDAALRIQEWFGVVPPVTAPKSERKKEAIKTQPPATEEANQVSEDEAQEGESGENKPLGFELRLDPAHPYLTERKLSPETIAGFGLGYCSKGTMAGRIAIPIHNGEGKLVAYAGRWPGEPPTETPRYKLPKGFRKSLEVFNLHRALTDDPSVPLIVVEGYFDCIWLWQLGFNVVSIMGSSLSEAQAALIVDRMRPEGNVVLLFDEDAAGREGREQALHRLVNRIFVKVLTLPQEGQQPEHLSRDKLDALFDGI